MGQRATLEWEISINSHRDNIFIMLGTWIQCQPSQSEHEGVCGCVGVCVRESNFHLVASAHANTVSGPAHATCVPNPTNTISIPRYEDCVSTLTDTETHRQISHCTLHPHLRTRSPHSLPRPCLHRPYQSPTVWSHILWLPPHRS